MAIACLSQEQLQELLDNSRSDESLADASEHLENCPHCRVALERLTLESLQLDPNLLIDIDHPEPEMEPALAALLNKARPDQPQDEGSSEHLIETEIRSFLKPSDTPGSIGRLDEYEIHGIIGRGGMGIVLKGFDPALCRTVALKLLAPHWSANALARRRFIREARATAAVIHEHIVTIHAVREEAPLPYLVMQYVQGTTLQDKLQKTGPLELKEVLRIGRQAAQGLAAAHSQGLVHRDIKPANILLENGVERVKITDFGLARAVDDASVTHSGVIAGTPEYMSPEQARGEIVDTRSDLFSLGSVLYALCTGRPPFVGSNALSVVRKVADTAAPDVRRFNAEVPAWLAKIIARLMARKPEDRYQSAAEIAAVLEDHLAELQNPPPVELPAPVAKRRPLRAVTVGVLLVAVAGLSFAEATGKTEMLQYVASVLRIHTPHGTLVLEIDDPAIKVAVNADGETITLTGAGPHELTLRPGEHQWQAIRDGKKIDGWVTIDRGEKQVLKVSMEGEEGENLVTNEPTETNSSAKSEKSNEFHNSEIQSEATPYSKDTYADTVKAYIDVAIEEASTRFAEDPSETRLGFNVTDLIGAVPVPPPTVTSLPGSQSIDGVSEIDIASNGRQALTLYSGRIALWNLSSAATYETVPGLPNPNLVRGARFSPDGLTFAVTTESGAQLYSTDDLYSIGRTFKNDSVFGSPTFSDSVDGPFLWFATGSEVIGFHARRGYIAGGFYIDKWFDTITSAGNLIVANGEKIILYDIPTKKTRTIDQKAFAIRGTQDGRSLFWCTPPNPRQSVVRYDLEKSQLETLVEDLPGISSFSVSADGGLLAYSTGRTCRVIKTDSRETVDELISIGETKEIELAPDGSFALVSGGLFTFHPEKEKIPLGFPEDFMLSGVIPSENLRLWKLADKPQAPPADGSSSVVAPTPHPKPTEEKPTESDDAAVPDASTNNDRNEKTTADLANPTDELLRTFKQITDVAREKALEEASIARRAQSPPGGGFGGGPSITEVVIHEPPEVPAEIEAFGPVDAPTKQVIISNNGKYGLSSHIDGPLKIWDLMKRELIQWAIDVRWNEQPQTLVFSPDSTKFMFKAGIAWETATGGTGTGGGLNEVPMASSIAFAADSKSYWVRSDEKVLAFEFDGHPYKLDSITMPQESNSVLAVSSQNLLAVSSRNKILLYDIEGKKFVGEHQHTAKISQLVFAPDGKTLYFGSTGGHTYQEKPPADGNPRHQIWAWTIAEAHPGRALPLPLPSIDSLSISADGKWIAAAGNTECWVQRIEGGDAKQLYAIGSISSIALSPDGSYALVGGGLYEQRNLRVRIPAENLRLWKLADKPEARPSDGFSSMFSLAHPKPTEEKPMGPDIEAVPDASTDIDQSAKTAGELSTQNDDAKDPFEFKVGFERSSEPPDLQTYNAAVDQLRESTIAKGTVELKAKVERAIKANDSNVQSIETQLTEAPTLPADVTRLPIDSPVYRIVFAHEKDRAVT